MFKIGLGLDNHRIKLKTEKEKLNSKKSLILAGVLISKDYYALADSDGDVIIHSLCNAISTAIGGGSLDTWAGPMFKKGITDSKKFLEVIVNKLINKGFQINNVSIMVEAQQPKLEKHRDKMQQSLAQLLDIEKSEVGIAFTTGQDLTVFGKGEGIQALTTILISK